MILRYPFELRDVQKLCSNLIPRRDSVRSSLWLKQDHDLLNRKIMNGDVADGFLVMFALFVSTIKSWNRPISGLQFTSNK